MALFDSASAKRALQIKAGKAAHRAMVQRFGLEYYQELGRKMHAASPSGRKMLARKQQASDEPTADQMDNSLDHSDQRSADEKQE